MHAWLACVLAVAAVAIGCRSRPLDVSGSGRIGLDAGAGAGGGSGGASGQGGAVGPGDGGPDHTLGTPRPLALGEPCTQAADCGSGFCVRATIGENARICCNVACESACASCDRFGPVGTCVSIPAGQSPRVPNACTVFSANHCSFDGTCDGVGSCHLWAAGSSCGTASACDGDAVVRMACDGFGACVPTPTQICVPYTCDPATKRCLNSCVTDADCAGRPCQPGGRCGFSPEQTCRDSAECASGFCVSGVCCNTACDDPCMTCNVPGRSGTCSPRPGGCPGVDGGAD